MTWYYILGGIFALLTLFYLEGTRLSGRAGAAAKVLVQSADEKYEEFIQKYIVNMIVEHQKFDIDIHKLSHKAMVILKPEIDALIGHINSTSYSAVKLKYISKYFKNAVSISESYFEKRNKNKQLLLSQNDREMLYEAFLDAIKSDLTSRLLDLDDGTF